MILATLLEATMLLVGFLALEVVLLQFGLYAFGRLVRQATFYAALLRFARAYLSNRVATWQGEPQPFPDLLKRYDR